MQFVFAFSFSATICIAYQTASCLPDDPDMVSTDDKDAALHLLVEHTRTVLEDMRTRQDRLRRTRQEARQDARHQRLRQRIQIFFCLLHCKLSL